MEIIKHIQSFAGSVISETELNIPKVKATPEKLNSILGIVFGIGGAVSVIIMVVAGIKLMLSRGDPKGIATARNTLIYAAVGLAICLSALAIVTFVVDEL